MAHQAIRRFRRKLIGLARQEAGMATAEYAIATLAAAAFGGILFAIVTGDSVTSALTQIIERALSVGF